ncbi:ABC transporter ATP-binding protein [Amycolatopsis pithecellobii]|uniref:ABC-type quaternary amine transporter n=1 Tax=Amycolatopsis pithecellobii TaxID=664692 RepID=A0A6N7YWH1_9PSEU|nr:ABC transporter ATP-binding protein [Amycolatopsis pithecellobii]MTD53223.1 ATP-binding cassette domain-containing protein [Amycolatopsis pithecellobii]
MTNTETIMDDDQVLVLDGVAKQYGGLPALSPTSLTVQRGEFLTLLGPSGSGKSTLLKLIAGFESPSSGAILLRSRDISGLSPAQRQLGMVFQSYSLFPHLTVAKNIEYGLKRRKWSLPRRRARVAEILAIVKLEHRAEALPAELSGGQQQRVAVARALAYDPDVLLMDEPLGALDRTLRLEMESEIKRIHGELGTTFIYVTHDQQEAMHLSTRIAIMNNSRVVALGTPDDLFRNPPNAFTAEFFSDATTVPAEIDSEKRFRWENGTGYWEAPAGMSPGRYTLGIRPRAARWGIVEGAPALRGKVRSSMLFGDEVRVLIDSDTVTGLRVIVPARATGFSPGEHVDVSIPWEDAILLPRET